MLVDRGLSKKIQGKSLVRTCIKHQHLYFSCVMLACELLDKSRDKALVSYKLWECQPINTLVEWPGQANEAGLGWPRHSWAMHSCAQTEQSIACTARVAHMRTY